MKLLVLATLFVLAESTAYFKNLCRWFQSDEHNAFDYEIERLRNLANYQQKEINEQIKSIYVEVNECLHYQKDFKDRVENDEFEKYQSEQRRRCQDPSEKIKIFQTQNNNNLVQPKGFIFRMFLSIEQIKQECIKAMTLNKAKEKENKYVSDEIWNLKCGRLRYLDEIEKRPNKK
jgi:TolA-binding protein